MSTLEIRSGSELAHAEHLLLRAPEQGDIDPTRETDHGEIQWLVARGDRLDDPRCQKPKLKQPPQGSAIEPLPVPTENSI